MRLLLKILTESQGSVLYLHGQNSLPKDGRQIAAAANLQPLKFIPIVPRHNAVRQWKDLGSDVIGSGGD